MGERDPDAVRRACTYLISCRRPVTMRDRLTGLAACPAADGEPDASGKGTLIADLETRVATLLGTDGAVFMPSGKTAQLIAVRLWCDWAGSPLQQS